MPSWLTALIGPFVVLNVVIGLVTYVTLLERKFAARMQSRIGPYRVGPHGLLQPIADAVKLMMKEDVVPTAADKPVYNLAPIVFLIPCMLIFATIPFAPNLGVADLDGGTYRVEVTVRDDDTPGVFVLEVDPAVHVSEGQTG